MTGAVVVGGGSIGKRHLRNLLASGRTAAVVEARADRRAEIARTFPGVPVFGRLEEALAADRYLAAFVCVPPALHLEPAFALARQGIHLFVEKPLSHTLDGIPELIDLVEKNGLVGLVGFSMRFFRPLQKAKELVDGGAVGRVVAARSLTGVYLPDWHPYEDYRTFYMARKELGGGVLLDECHAFDWMQWLCGPIESVFAVVGTFSDLEVTTDDVTEVVARFRGRAVGSIHLDMVDRSARSEVEIIGTASTLLVDLEGQAIRLWEPEARRWRPFTFEPGYDRMYVDELDHFFACVKGRERPRVDLRQGYQVQRVLDACARSAQSGRVEPVE